MGPPKNRQGLLSSLQLWELPLTPRTTPHLHQRTNRWIKDTLSLMHDLTRGFQYSEEVGAQSMPLPRVSGTKTQEFALRVVVSHDAFERVDSLKRLTHFAGGSRGGSAVARDGPHGTHVRFGELVPLCSEVVGVERDEAGPRTEKPQPEARAEAKKVAHSNKEPLSRKARRGLSRLST